MQNTRISIRKRSKDENEAFFSIVLTKYNVRTQQHTLSRGCKHNRKEIKLLCKAFFSSFLLIFHSYSFPPIYFLHSIKKSSSLDCENYRNRAATSFNPGSIHQRNKIECVLFSWCGKFEFECVRWRWELGKKMLNK